MCGMCGVASDTLATIEKEVFKDLLMLNQWRGMDSTGMFSVSEVLHKNKLKTGVKVAKEEFDATYFLTTENKEKKEAFKTDDKIVMVGHCRSATIGVAKAENAHPFEFSNVVGVHNGTLVGAYPYEKEYETDSQALYRSINDHGIEDTLKELTVGSAYSLIWYDKKEHKLHFLRNDKRPLWFTWIYSKSSLLWSSERRALNFIAGPDGRFTTHEPFFQWKEHQLITLDLNKGIKETSITGRDIKPPVKYAAVTTSYTGNRNPQDWWNKKADYYGQYGDEDLPWTNYPTANTPSTMALPRPVAIDPPKKNNGTSSSLLLAHKDHGPKYLGYKVDLLNEDVLLDILVHGCCLCEDVPDPMDDKDLEYKIGWTTKDRFVCENCIKQEDWVMTHMVEWQNIKLDKGVTK